MRSRPTSPQPDTRANAAARHDARSQRAIHRATPVGSLRAHTVVADVQTRAAGSGAGELTVEGYAAVFEQPSEVMSFWGMEWDERIASGAFTTCLQGDPDVRFMGQHEGNALARTTNGTLELKEDETGLWFRASLNPDVQEARDLYALIERGDITQMSFGFQMAPPATISCEKLGHDLCAIDHDLITEVTRLYEISAVTFPAYPQTSVEGGERSVVVNQHFAAAPDIASAARSLRAAMRDLTLPDEAVAAAGALIEQVETSCEALEELLGIEDDDAPDEDDDAATLAARSVPPTGEDSTRDALLRSRITEWTTRWSTCGRSVPSS